MKSIRTAAIAGILAAVPITHADTIAIVSDRDNTLFNTGSSTSSGAGETVFSGRTGTMAGGIRQRAVLHFDVAGAIPAGSTVQSAALSLWVIQAGAGGTQSHTLHRVSRDWGEGTSNAFGGSGAPATTNDATWNHTYFPNGFWSSPGGDFDPTPSATQFVGDPGPVTWASAEMAADVQSWLDTPGANFGWLVRGNESAFNTAKKFGSREAVVPMTRPALLIEFDPPAPTCPADLDDSGDVGFGDILAIIGAYGPCAPACPAEDLDGNGDVGFSDVLVVIGAWGVCG